MESVRRGNERAVSFSSVHFGLVCSHISSLATTDRLDGGRCAPLSARFSLLVECCALVLLSATAERVFAGGPFFSRPTRSLQRSDRVGAARCAEDRRAVEMRRLQQSEVQTTPLAQQRVCCDRRVCRVFLALILSVLLRRRHVRRSRVLRRSVQPDNRVTKSGALLSLLLFSALCSRR